MTEEKKNVEETKDDYELVNVPTQHTQAIQSKDGTILSIEEGIVLILNKIENMKKLIG